MRIEESKRYSDKAINVFVAWLCIGVLLVCLVPLIQGIGNSMIRDILLKGEMVCFNMVYAYSLWLSVRAYRLKKTKYTKTALLIIIGIPIAVFVIGSGLLYVFWSAFGGFAPEKTTFWEFLSNFFKI